MTYVAMGNLRIHVDFSAPIISVVIPTYNRADMVARAVSSVVEQTFTTWELLIIDDGSDDGTKETIERFDDPRIHYVRHSINRGAQAARNTGIQTSIGQYIAFLDSDDEWHPKKLEKQLNLFLQSDDDDLGVVLCDISIIDDVTGKNVVIPSSGKPVRGWVYDDLLAGRLKGPKTSRVLVKKLAMSSDINFDESLPASQEMDFLIRMAAKCKFGYVSEPLVIVHHHRGPRVSDGMNDLLGKEMLIEKFSIQLRQRPKILRRRHLSLAIDYWKRRDASSARRHTRQAVLASPLYASSYLWLIFAACGPDVFGTFLQVRKRLSIIRRRITRHGQKAFNCILPQSRVRSRVD